MGLDFHMRSLERRAGRLTVREMKEQLGLGVTVRGHSRFRRARVVELWLEHMRGIPGRTKPATGE
jgi:hypothetical protein